MLALLRARATSASRPGARADGARLALVLEGGGMRGIVSAAVTAALERGGLTDAFDLVVGTSAGALNGAAFLAGVAGPCCEEYAGAFASRRFYDPLRLLRGRPAVDVEFVLDFANATLDADRHARTAASPLALHALATDVETAEGHDLAGLRTLDELRRALLATSRLPLVGGEPVALRGRRWLDGGLAEAVPLATALRLGATHALVVQTLPEGAPYPRSGGRLGDALVERRLRALNPRLVERYRGMERAYAEISARVRELGRAPGPPFVLGLRPPPGAPAVALMELRAHVLRAAADAALQQTEREVVAPVRA